MKLVFISDTHGYLRERDIPDGDVLIHCGDACSSGQFFEFNYFRDQMRRLATRFKLVLYTPGNHDRYVEERPALAKHEFEFELPNIHLLIHEPFEFEGVKFFGSPYTPRFNNWAFMYDREDGKQRWQGVPDDTDVFFCHGMPYGILDAVGADIRTGETLNVGCEALGGRINQIKPKVFAGGHLHLQGGQKVEIDGTTYINAAICDDSYFPSRPAMEIDI